MSRENAIRKIIARYGARVQIEKSVEECAELIQALMKPRSPREIIESVVDELADVSIMLEQLKLIFFCADQVEERIDFKIKRQLERIEKENVK